MSDRRVVFGKRADGTLGVFVSPVGIDAFTATDDQLLLNISSKIPQLILLGAVASSQSVPLGVGRAPYVFLTNRQSMGTVPGYGALDGPVRPSPNFAYGAPTGFAYADVASDGSAMSVSVPGGNRVAYAVYNIPFS
ncbi:hypothetical protein SAMN03159423_4880 [Bradyrhizobium sp. NFR13]|uniref:hypothetical protein n=1 Tax=Bradyrhizobium sp. NFR13 TaxID=1566285 RepID=UPI0008E94F12|nr:hypothetical protein [Bradyrhizobium sp. NFR13]SFM00753.1 hypothetical protein SAMN03159423_4880 [Bradyrhizobium sp. NFR13]